MAYSVRIHREALKAYRRLDKGLQTRVDEALGELADDPWRYDLDIKKLHGQYVGYYRLRISTVRVVYAIDPRNRVVFIDGISHRGSAYK